MPPSRQRSVITTDHVSIRRFMSRRLCPDHGQTGSYFRVKSRSRKLKDRSQRIKILMGQRKSRVPDTFQLGAIPDARAFLACRRINNLRVFNTSEYSDSPRLHQILRNAVVSSSLPHRLSSQPLLGNVGPATYWRTSKTGKSKKTVWKVTRVGRNVPLRRYESPTFVLCHRILT